MEGQYLRVNVISILTTVVDLIANAFVIFVLHGGMFELALGTSFIVCCQRSIFPAAQKTVYFSFLPKKIDIKTCWETIY